MPLFSTIWNLTSSFPSFPPTEEAPQRGESWRTQRGKTGGETDLYEAGNPDRFLSFSLQFSTSVSH